MMTRRQSYSYWQKLRRLAPLALTGAAMSASACSAAESEVAEENVSVQSEALCGIVSLAGVASSASSEENATLPSILAFDGNPSTRWASAYSDLQWIRLDLGASRYIDSVKLVWEYASAADYTIQLSNDGNSWTTVASKTGAPGGARTDVITALSSRVGRYVRVQATRRADPTYGYSLYEFVVNGATDANCTGSSSRSIATNLEAESNNAAAGVAYETTSDAGGGQNANNIESGDYIEWNIQVPTSGQYTLTTRSATVGNASLQVLVDGSAKTTLNLSNTGGLQNWSNFKSSAFSLSGGNRKLRVKFTSSGQNLNFVKVAPASSLVEVRVPQSQDLVYLAVNGVRHRIGPYGQPTNEQGWQDVSAWFASGTNNLRLWATNWNGDVGFQFELRVDGNPVLSRSCQPGSCATRENGVYFADSSLQVSGLNLPPLKNVLVTGTDSGKLYLDNEFTGLTTPATLKLPSGSYRIGLGVSNDLPGAMTGRFHEKVVQVAQSALTVNMNTTGTPLGTQNVVTIALLPVKYATGTDLTRTAVLLPSEVTRFAAQIQATRTQWVKPYSYGLTDWNVTVLPMVTDIVEHDGEVMSAPQYQALYSQYNVVILYGPSYDANGVAVAGLTGGAWSGGQQIRINSEWSTPLPDDYANEGLLHEMLHQYDGDQRDWMYHYTGVNELHGADVHGFHGTDNEEGRAWIRWYRYFMRGQAAEVSTMSSDSWLATPIAPASAEWFVGTFRTIRWGLDTHNGQ